MPTLIASVSDADFSGRQLVGETEETTVRTGVGAEALRPQKIDSHKSADEEKRNGDCDGWESFPKIACNQMVGKLGDERLVLRRGEESVCGGPNEHIQCDNERHENQKPRAKRLRFDA